MTSKNYVVRDAGARPAPGASYPYTLRGLEDALEHAAFRSAFWGQAQEVAVVGDGEDRVIRRYEDGHEADRPPGTSRTAHPPGPGRGGRDAGPRSDPAGFGDPDGEDEQRASARPRAGQADARDDSVRPWVAKLDPRPLGQR